VKNLIIRGLGIVLVMTPFACVAISGGRTEGAAGAEIAAGGDSGTTPNTSTGGTIGTTYASTGGSTGTATTTATVDAGAPPDTTAVYGVERTSPYPCAANTAAYYDEPPLSDPTAGCKDIYNSTQSYPAGCTRTIVAPTAPAGASCVAYDCWCSAVTKRWEPSNSNFCW
jgi:hypothetical protein